jgi:hypothetical protein
MRAKLFYALGLALLVAVIAAGVVALKRANSTLREKVAGLASMNQQVDALRDENMRLRESLTRFQQESNNAQQVLRTELLKAQGELAAAEKTARERRVQYVEHAVAQAENTDPDRGVARLEHFKNVGRATPAAAFQTMVWAVMNREDGLVATALSVTGPAREKADALLNQLPPAERARFPSPESLGILAITEQVLKAEGMVLREFTSQNSGAGVLAIRMPEPGRPENTKDGKVQMVLGPSGWQVVVPEKAIDEIIRRISRDAAADPTKK